MTKTEYIDKLIEMVYDINPEEIASHIENDSLRKWIYAWHSEICNRIHMINLIKEIDQNVLDEIRHEIVALDNYYIEDKNNCVVDVGVKYGDVLQIIYKYSMIESEE